MQHEGDPMREPAIGLNLLAVDDDPSMVREIESMLEDAHLNFHFADTSNAIARLLETESIDLALIHLHDGSVGLLDPLTRQLREISRPIGLIAMVEQNGAAALTAARAGVDGCVLIDDPRALSRVIGQRAILLRQLAAQAEGLRRVSDIHERYNLLLESSSEAIAYLHEGLHIYANPSYLQLFGYLDFGELEGFSILDLLVCEDGSVDLKQLLKSLTRGELPEGELALDAIQSDGSSFRVAAEFAPAHYDGEACTQIMVRERLEASDSTLLEEELEKLRSQDLLTGLLNRQAFIKTLHSELEQPPQGHMAVLLATLDNHSALQTKVGAAATDILIRQAAEIFREVISEELLLTRLSDHIFAARLWFNERSEAEALATKVVETFSGRILEIRDKSPQVTASVGLAVGGSQTFSADELLAQAETALREAERTGGNSYVRYRPSSGSGADDGEHWDEKLRHALNNEEFRLVSLPITSMEDDEFLINEFETRLRLEGSDEIIMPSTFRPAAQRAGLSVALDRDMIQHVLRWRAANPDFAGDMLLPISAACISDDEFIAWLQQLVDDAELDGPRILFGFYETEIRENLRELQRLISRFAIRGVKFVLLDVSIAAKVDLLLKNIKVDYIKLSADIAPALRGDETGRRTLEQMIAAGADQETRFIAPQVDNTSELAALWQFGITLVQDDFVREEN